MIYAIVDLSHVAHFFVLLPLSVFLTALLAAEAPWLKVEPLAALPGWAQLLILFVLTVFYAYWYHRLQHSNAYLWQFHKVHQSQRQLTGLTVFRMSILDRVVNLVALSVPAAIMGVSPAMPATLLILLQFHQTLLHSDTGWTFGRLRHLFVSPAFHDVHHSTAAGHANRNYAPVLAIWDHLFGSFSARGQDELEFGLDKEKVPESFTRQIFVPAVGLWRQLQLDLGKGKAAAPEAGAI